MEYLPEPSEPKVLPQEQRRWSKSETETKGEEVVKSTDGFLKSSCLTAKTLHSKYMERMNLVYLKNKDDTYIPLKWLNL